MRISLREILLVITVAAVGLAALQSASLGMLPILAVTTGLLICAFLVRAVVCRGAKQAFAIGFVVCGLLWLVGNVGTLTSLDPLHDAIATQEWVKSSTGQPNGEFFTRRQTASQEDFQTAGDCLATLLVGCVGGRIAQFVVARRAMPNARHNR